MRNTEQKTMNDLIATISVVLSCIVSAAALIFSVLIYSRQKKDEHIKTLAKQVIAYHVEESIAIEQIKQLNPKLNKNNIKADLRDKTAQHPKSEGTRPSMNASTAKKYL